MKIYVLMPTYNDADSIVESLDSIMMQTYTNWNLIIVDDGSTDNTKEVIKKYCQEKDKNHQIKYIYQENKDQLNALKNACNYIKNKNSLVYILHSDDLLNDEKVFEKAESYMKNNNCDAIISDPNLIDENSKLIGRTKIKNYINKKYILPLQLLWLGRNLYMDLSFTKSKIFLKQVYNNYLTWNGPFWLNLDTNDLLNVHKVDFNVFKYRVFAGNYINNKLGKLCVINGEIRVVTRLLKYYYLPCYKIQFYIYRIFNKLKLGKLYRPIYLNRETKNKGNIIKFVLNKRFTDQEIEENFYLSSLLKFYQNYQNRIITIDKISKTTPIYFGSDLRIFNKQIIDNNLPDLYVTLLTEMKTGFNKIEVKKEDYENVLQITKFLAIYPYVEVVVK